MHRFWLANSGMERARRMFQVAAFFALLPGTQGIASPAPRFPAAVESAHDPIGSVQGLVARLLGPGHLASFTFSVVPADAATGHDVFALAAGHKPGTVAISGNKGLSLAAGLGHYLKYTLNCSWSWGREGSGNQLAGLPLPGRLPPPATSERVVSPVKVRYTYNVCTFGYTMAYWDASQWQAEIDRLALWGVNAPLQFVGQELVWLLTYTDPEIGLKPSDVLEDFFSGSAFAPWQRMGNIQRWGGPVNMAWVNGQADLGKQILAMMRAYGMTPILPGFAGHVPAALATKFPGSSFTKSADWNGFNATYGSDYLLEPQDPLYSKLGAIFYKALNATFGTDHLYNADTFNEMDPSSKDPEYLKATNAAIYRAMTTVDPDAIFVMQGWLFINSPGFWQAPEVKAFLSGVPDHAMLILDLYSESATVANCFESYYGKPWVWNMLQVFGGRRALYGSLPDVAFGPVANASAPGSTMAGIGMTPEATEITPVTFDLLFEMGWRSSQPALREWLGRWVGRRYPLQGRPAPSLQQAWSLLLDGVYSLPKVSYGTTTNLCWIESSPQLGFDPSASPPPGDSSAVPAALRLFLKAIDDGEVDATSSTFRYDLVDLARQLACNVFADQAHLNGAAYFRFAHDGINSTAQVAATTSALSTLIDRLDAILRSDINYNGFGTWLADAASWAKGKGDPAYAANLAFNARNQVTMWGPNGEINDYAAKNGWAGLTGDYYGGRWGLHGRFVREAVASGKAVDWAKYEEELKAFQWAFQVNQSSYPTTPEGDTVSLIRALASAYAGYGNSPLEASAVDVGVPRGYRRVPGTDAVAGGAVPRADIIKAWNSDIQVLASLCDVEPTCLGFNGNGWLKNSTATLVQSSAVDLYVKVVPQLGIMSTEVVV